MWTPEHRLAADRSGLRYPSDLTDAEWAIVEPMIPPARHEQHRRIGERLLDPWRQDFRVGSDPHEEVQVIILGQDHRPWCVKVTMQVKDERSLCRRHVTATELGRLDLALPAASPAQTLFSLGLERGSSSHRS